MCILIYSRFVMMVQQSRQFMDWMNGLRDLRARSRILARIDRLKEGHFGDVSSVGGGVAELRVDHGPGYRVYFARRGQKIVLLLCGGDKSSQQRDITQAIGMAKEWNVG